MAKTTKRAKVVAAKAPSRRARRAVVAQAAPEHDVRGFLYDGIDPIPVLTGEDLWDTAIEHANEVQL